MGRLRNLELSSASRTKLPAARIKRPLAAVNAVPVLVAWATNLHVRRKHTSVRLHGEGAPERAGAKHHAQVAFPTQTM